METGNKLLSPKFDFIFKRIFGNVNNTEIVESFLRCTLDLPEEEYGRISIIDPHLRKESQNDKFGILDVLLQTTSGKMINIEIQVSTHTCFTGRIMYYISKMITGQMASGTSYEQIKKVISIIIADHLVMPQEMHYHNVYRMLNDKTNTLFSDLQEIHLIELPKLPSKYDGSKMYNWVKFLSAEDMEEFEMLAKKDPEIKKAVGVLKELSEDETLRLLADSREKFLLDQRAMRKDALEEGAKEVASTVIKNALEMGLAMEDIMKLTELSEKEISQILEKL